MDDFAIRVEDLSKRYWIGGKQEQYKTLRDTLTDALMSPFRRAARLLRGKATGAAELNETIWALKDISFEVTRGEVVGIIGRNGAGKSTLLKILSRITEPTAGFAEIHGRVGALLEVGTGFHPELTGRENVYLNGAILGMRRAEIARKFDEIVAFAEVEKFIDTPVKHYSSGMYVRLAFAVAAHLEPEILLVDEVLSVGDFAFQRKCLGKIHDVAGYGRTVIFVSHNLGAVKTLCNRCICLEEGKVLDDGPAHSVVDRYVDQCNEAIQEHRPGRIEADSGECFVLHHQDNYGDITISCGDPITIEFIIEAPKPLSETDMGIGMTIVDKMGNPLVSMSSVVQRVPNATGLSRFWRARCDMGCLPINAGIYFAWVYVGDALSLRMLARFSNAITIRVMEHDVFGWGASLPPASYWGPIYWAPQWDIRPVE